MSLTFIFALFCRFLLLYLTTIIFNFWVLLLALCSCFLVIYFAIQYLVKSLWDIRGFCKSSPLFRVMPVFSDNCGLSLSYHLFSSCDWSPLEDTYWKWRCVFPSLFSKKVCFLNRPLLAWGCPPGRSVYESSAGWKTSFTVSWSMEFYDSSGVCKCKNEEPLLLKGQNSQRGHGFPWFT